MDTDTRNALLDIMRFQKAQYILLAKNHAELIALRETVKGLDPSFTDVMESRRKQVEAIEGPKDKAILAKFDESIAAFSEGR